MATAPPANAGAATLAPGREFHAALHGLRGVAVLYVVLSHLGNGGLFLLPLAHDSIGKVGVWIFFALSAFLLTTHLTGDLEGGAPAGATIGRYAVQRVFRIYPLFVVVLLLHWGARHLDGPQVVGHLLLLQGWGELWAIPVEFQFYACIPLIALAARHGSRRLARHALLAVLAAAVAWGCWQPAAVFSNGLAIGPKLAPFVAGSWLALWRLDHPLPGGGAARARVLLAASVLALAAVTLVYRLLSRGRLPDDAAALLSLVLALATAGLIASALDPRLAFGRLVAARPLVHVGRISFSLYLLHMFAIAASGYAGWPPTGRGWLALAIALAASALAYRVVEAPGIRAGRRLADAWWPARR